MSTTAAFRAASTGPLIALVGIGPRVGVTATTVALARTWPGPETSILVEADLAGGRLAALNGGDPYLGSASLARTVDPDTPVEADRVAAHLQFLPSGVALLAAPPGRSDRVRVGLTRSLLIDARPALRAMGAAVFADCGAPEPGSPLTPILTAADACLIVVRADLADPDYAAHRIHRLTDSCRARGVLLIGATPHGDYAHALALPILGTLPLARTAARALLHGTRPPRRRPHLLPAARTISTALRRQLQPPAPAPRGGPRTADPPTPRHRGTRRRPAPPPTVYRLDPATITPEPARPIAPRPAPPPPAPVPVPVTIPVAPALRSDDGTAEHPTPRPEPAPPSSAPPSPVAPSPAPPSPASTGPQPDTAEPGLAITVFGPTRLVWRATEHGPGVDITARLSPRSRELLTVLALHPDGLGRDRLIDLVWGELAPEQPRGALANNVSRLRAAVAAATDGRVSAVLTNDRLHYRLSEDGVTVDYRRFGAAVAARRHATHDRDRAAACREITAYAGTALATDLTHPWVEPIREAARRDTLNALGWLAAHTEDPHTTLGLLETAIENDPYNEHLWQEILRLHHRLGEHDALGRAYTLLTHKLAEIGEKPSQETRRLLDDLRHKKV
ncbi:AfsR/SARP family transcriptional regulator [Nocardia bovistercoris]|uniref:Bacterial transcriptional activator domain-containing protein n=1 Tax=Nocardia bovistercoris TaxID=2785916 RepID=A0A931IDB4_9NOCA|nr:BTAD domain-containing putative transcriptional regulator [Nocardia bovistercoris]MBH0777693.1 hypothetical protein [Nocardia bovistercoris]